MTYHSPAKLPGPCSVYVIAASRHVKIGMARMPRARLHALQTGNPDLLFLMHHWPLGSDQEAARFEQILHGAFVWASVGGEWFGVNEAEVRAVGDAFFVGKADRAYDLAEIFRKQREVAKMVLGADDEEDRAVWRTVASALRQQAREMRS